MTAAARDDTPVVIEGGGVELRTQAIGDGLSVAFVRFPQGTGMRPA